MATMKSTIGATRPVVHLMVMIVFFFMAFIVTLPFMVDVFLGALCPGKTECSQVMILMGVQQVVQGASTVLLAPVLGSASDDYGRKPVLMVICFSSILPPLIIAYSKTKVAVYIWFFSAMVVATLRDGGLTPTILAYVADVVDESQRAVIVGVTMSATAAGFLLGTMSSFALKTAFQAYVFATVLQTCAAVYLTVFVKESNPRRLLPAESSQRNTKLLPNPGWNRQTTTLRQTARTVWSSRRLRMIALVDFMSFLVGTASLQAFTMYFLKSIFDFGKNQYATLTVVNAACLAFGQMLVYPALSYFLGDRGVLWIGLLGFSAHYFIYGLAWAPWVPYLGSGIGAFSSFLAPSLGSMASKGTCPDQQGKVQGFLSGIKSTANIISPLVMTPLTAMALGDNPPFHLRGFPFLVGGSITLVALLIAFRVPPHSPCSPEETVEPTDYTQAPSHPEDSIHSNDITA